MDMSVFSQQLEDAGFTIPDDRVDRFSTSDEFVLPYVQSCANIYEMEQKIINDANYIDRSKKPLEEKEFVDYVKILSYDDVSQKIYDWVLDHIEQVRVVDRGGMHKKPGSFNNAKDFSDRYDRDTEYGLVALGYYIKYDKVGMTLKLDIHEGYKINSMLGNRVDVWDYHKSDSIIGILDELYKVSEFIPIDLRYGESNVYTNFSGLSKPKLQECVSSYGNNIINDEAVMEGLVKSGWMQYNTKINPRVWYFVIMGNFGLYLKRDLTKSPRIQNDKK